LTIPLRAPSVRCRSVRTSDRPRRQHRRLAIEATLGATLLAPNVMIVLEPRQTTTDITGAERSSTDASFEVPRMGGSCSGVLTASRRISSTVSSGSEGFPTRWDKSSVADKAVHRRIARCDENDAHFSRRHHLANQAMSARSDQDKRAGRSDGEAQPAADGERGSRRLVDGSIRWTRASSIRPRSRRYRNESATGQDLTRSIVPGQAQGTFLDPTTIN